MATKNEIVIPPIDDKTIAKLRAIEAIGAAHTASGSGISLNDATKLEPYYVVEIAQSTEQQSG